MTWKEFNADPMGRLLNAGIAVSAVAGVYTAFSTNHIMSLYLMMGAVLVTVTCGIASIGLALNSAPLQAMVLIFVLPLVSQVYFAWAQLSHDITDPPVGVVMIIATLLFTYLALFPPKPTTSDGESDADSVPEVKESDPAATE